MILLKLQFKKIEYQLLALRKSDLQIHKIISHAFHKKNLSTNPKAI